ncbi:hypothetical protein GEMRC1_013970 [Eukaryota sp. GEM-RC1]
MIISRSTDSSIISFSYCFKKPTILSVSNDPFPLHGHISIFGSDFSTSFEFFSLSFSFPQVIVNNHTHNEITLYVPYICDISSNKFDIYLIVGNQTSNLFVLTFAPPEVSYQPIPLSPSGELILFDGPNFSKMYQCFHNSSLDLSVSSASYEIIDENEIEILTGDLYGITEFVISVQFFPQFIRLISIPVTSFVANNAEYVCFVGIPCYISVYSFLEDFSFTNTFINSNIPNSLQISNYQSSPSFAEITFTSSVSGVPNEIRICSDSACYPIFNLPFVVSPSYMFPQNIQWFGKPLTHNLAVEIEGISLYDYSIIQNSFNFVNFSSELISIVKSTIHFEVLFSTTGNINLQILSFGRLSNLFSLKVSNFVLIPPKVIYNSIIECYLFEHISDLFITHGNSIFDLSPGPNILNISNTSSSISLSQFSESINISSVSSFFDDVLPSIIEINLLQSILIDIVDPSYSYSVSVSDNCQLTDTHTRMNQFQFNIVGLQLGIVELTFFVQYFQSNLNFVHHISVHQPPLVQLVSPTVISLSNPQPIIISFVGDFCPSSLFLVNDILTNPNEVLEHSNSNLEYSYIFNISIFNLSKGENHQDWYWKHSGFNLQHLGAVVIFDIDTSSTDSVSVFQHRTISINFEGNLYSNLTCSIDSQQFKGSTSNNSLSCEDVIIPTYQEFVLLELSFNGFTVDSLQLQGEAFLEEVCFVTFSEHPKLNLSNSISDNLIFDDIRCCNVDVSRCSHYFAKFQSIVVNLNSTFDIFQIVITTNSSCEESQSNLPFDLLIDNQTLSPSYYCHQIPSGFVFASMCTIDVIIPHVSELVLIALEAVYLLELEVYGYLSNSCVKPFSFGHGITALGDLIEENVYLEFQTSLFDSINHFESFLSKKQQLLSVTSVTFDTTLFSSNCIHSFTPFPVTIYASASISLVLNQTTVEIDPKYLTISIPCFCVDVIGFIVDCDIDFSVVSSTLLYADFNFDSIYLTFSFHDLPQLQEHSLWYKFNSAELHWNGTIVQKFAELLTVSYFESFDCDHQFYGNKACTVLNISTNFIVQHQFYNLTREVPLLT